MIPDRAPIGNATPARPNWLVRVGHVGDASVVWTPTQPAEREAVASEEAEPE